MVYRAIKICSTYSSLDAEFNFIRQVAANNGYPMAFVESVIRRQLNLLYAPPVAKRQWGKQRTPLLWSTGWPRITKESQGVPGRTEEYKGA